MSLNVSKSNLLKKVNDEKKYIYIFMVIGIELRLKWIVKIK